MDLMTNLSEDELVVGRMFRRIIDAQRDIQARLGHALGIFISEADARTIAFATTTGEFKPRPDIKAGDTIQILGMPTEVRADVPEGVIYIGKRISTEPDRCKACGQDIPESL